MERGQKEHAAVHTVKPGSRGRESSRPRTYRMTKTKLRNGHLWVPLPSVVYGHTTLTKHPVSTFFLRTFPGQTGTPLEIKCDFGVKEAKEEAFPIVV